MRWAFVLVFASCNAQTSFDCDAVAIDTEAGEPDPCDVSACEACVDACGGRCVILESYPPQYSCGAGGSWSVYDFCPEWVLPGST